jgi:uncharacterized protein with gpF-like domain
MQIVVAKSLTDPRWLKRHSHGKHEQVGFLAGKLPEKRLRTTASGAMHLPATIKKPRHFIAKMSSADQAELDRLLRQTDQISAKFRQAFLDAVNNLGDRIDIGQIRSLLEQGRVDQAIQTVDAQLTAQGFTPVAQAITGAAVRAAQQSASAVNALGSLNISFGITNPQTVNFLRTYEMGLIRAMSQDALASVRTAIQAGVAAGRNPIDTARDVRQFIGLTDSQTKAVLNYRNALTQGSRDALSRQLRDRRFDPTVARAARGESVLSNDQIDNMVSRYAARYLKYRSETIARTESIRALNAGNLQLWNQAAASGKVDAQTVTRKWITAGDDRVRDSHAALDGAEVGLNEPFDSDQGPIMYPGDPSAPASMTINCRCTLIYRFKAAQSQ